MHQTTQTSICTDAQLGRASEVRGMIALGIYLGILLDDTPRLDVNPEGLIRDIVAKSLQRS